MALWTVGVLSCIYIAITLFLYLYQDSFIFPERPISNRSPLSEGFATFDPVQLAIGQDKSEAWFIPNQPSRGVVLFSHGNGQTMGERLEMSKAFYDMGFSLFLYEYGGYWNSTGEASETRCYGDIRAAWDYLTTHRGIEPGRILIFGESMGTGPSVELAHKTKPGALVLLSPFTSIAAVASETFPYVPVNMLLRHRFDNAAKITAVTSPLMILHGADDTIVPFEHGRELFHLANNPKEFIRLTGDHGAFYQDTESFTNAVRAFVEPLFPVEDGG